MQLHALLTAFRKRQRRVAYLLWCGLHESDLNLAALYNLAKWQIDLIDMSVVWWWLGRRTCDQQVASSTPGRALLG